MKKLLVLLCFVLSSCSTVPSRPMVRIVCINIKNENTIMDVYAYQISDGEFTRLDDNNNSSAHRFTIPVGKNIRCSVERIDE